MSMIVKPACLHIPVLCEGEAALITWNKVDGAANYKLDIAYDKAFEEAVVGMPWRDIDLDGLTWAEFEVKNYSWADIHRLMPSFAAWRGEGDAVEMLPLGLTWANIERFGGNWQQIDGRGWRWRDLEQRPEMGQSWAELDSRCATWQEIDAQGLSWLAFEMRPRDIGPHLSCKVDIRAGVRFAYLRLQAVGPMGVLSEYIISNQCEVMAMTKVEVTTIALQRFHMLAESVWMKSFSGRIFTLLYDQSHLKFESLALQAGGHALPLPRGLRIIDKKPGEMQFTCSQPVAQQTMLSGLFALLFFVALKSGKTTVQLKHQTM